MQLLHFKTPQRPISGERRPQLKKLKPQTKARLKDCTARLADLSRPVWPLIAFTYFGMTPAFSATCPDTIETNITDCTVDSDRGQLTITESASVTGKLSITASAQIAAGQILEHPGLFLIKNFGQITEINNLGNINGAPYGGIYNAGSISTLINTGMISTTGAISNENNSTQQDAIVNRGTIGHFINTGTILASAPGGASALFNQIGSIISITNTGVISGSNGIWNNASIGSITNIGTITGNNGLAAINLFSGSVDSIINSGAITGAIDRDSLGIYVYETEIPVKSILNTGIISGNYSGIYVRGAGVETITNTGLIHYTDTTAPNSSVGATTAAAITTLNNLQGPGTVIPSGVTLSNVHVNNALIYRGGLPQNYNIIVRAPGTYGSLIYQYRALTPSPGSMTFNIYGNTGTTLVTGVPASTLTNGTYNGVLRNFFVTASAATANYGAGSAPAVLLGTAGTYGTQTWTLQETATDSGTWDLVVCCGTTDGTDGGGTSTDIGTTATPNFANALSGEIYAAAWAVVPQTTQRLQRAVMARLGDTSTQTTGLNGPNSNPQGRAERDVWGVIDYQHGSRPGDSSTLGFKSHLYQAVFGNDLYRHGDTRAGAGFSLSNTNLSNSTGSASLEQGSVFVYGKLPVLQNLMLDGMASLGVYASNASRTDPTTGGSLTAQGIRGHDALVSAGISQRFEITGFEWFATPFAQLSWQGVKQSAFDETNGSEAALTGHRHTTDGWRRLIGVTLGSQRHDPLVDAYTFKATLAAGIDSSRLNNPSLGAQLAGFGTSLQTRQVGAAFAQLGLSGTLKLTNKGYAYAGITGEGRRGEKLVGVNFGFHRQF